MICGGNTRKGSQDVRECGERRWRSLETNLDRPAWFHHSRDFLKLAGENDEYVGKRIVR